ncbi:helix-turn-helix transcriptional regulator [Clostridium botulinum C/D]|uniref:helix-turn-helix domain-containing protein n=1 Tax=Clostridium botulinum TaxID=1491 RepID=UPI001E472F19|nr:helix-turn-helix transcriptional regulator [Clostridium botulinum]MCD3211782.1 helix-turn-helix transcriptional regulator [Clostridium botulinum C/D]
MDIKKIIALNIYTLRNKHNLTQEEFASKLNYTGEMSITRGHISRIENGNHIPSAEFIRAVANTFDIDVNWLLATQKSDNVYDLISDKEIDLIARFRQLPANLQNQILDLLNSILELS